MGLLKNRTLVISLNRVHIRIKKGTISKAFLESDSFSGEGFLSHEQFSEKINELSNIDNKNIMYYDNYTKMVVIKQKYFSG